MKIFPAKSFDIPDILKIEHAAFIPAIQEKQATFEERLRVFPEGFLLLSDNSPKTVLENGKPLTAGYFTSEILIIADENANPIHIASFALLPAFQGKKLAEPFLTGCLDSICGAFPQIKQIILLVNEEWHGAKHLYEKLGFKELRTIKDFFPSLKKSASDGIVMLKSAE